MVLKFIGSFWSDIACFYPKPLLGVTYSDRCRSPIVVKTQSRGKRQNTPPKRHGFENGCFRQSSYQAGRANRALGALNRLLGFPKDMTRIASRRLGCELEQL